MKGCLCLAVCGMYAKFSWNRSLQLLRSLAVVPTTTLPIGGLSASSSSHWPLERWGQMHIYLHIVFWVFFSLCGKWHVCVCVMWLFCRVILNSPSLLSFQCPQNRITVACWGGYAASLMRCQKTSLLLLLCCLQRWDLDSWWGALFAKMFKVVSILPLKFPKNRHKWDH